MPQDFDGIRFRAVRDDLGASIGVKVQCRLGDKSWQRGLWRKIQRLVIVG
jgi:hypothetical protein